MLNFNFEELAANYNVATKGKAGVSSLRIVYSDSGVNIALSATLLKELGDPKTLQVFSDETYVFVGNIGVSNLPKYDVKAGGKVYCATVVKKIVDDFGLKYKVNTKEEDRIVENGYSASSKAFQDVQFQMHGKNKIAIIKIDQGINDEIEDVEEFTEVQVDTLTDDSVTA